MENLIKDIMQVFYVKEDTAKEFVNILSQIVKISDKAYEKEDQKAMIGMNDCISRADAIRWVKTECNPYVTSHPHLLSNYLSTKKMSDFCAYLFFVVTIYFCEQ